MKNTVKLYQASIPYGTNGLKIYEAEFIETDKQFKRTGDHAFVVPKNRGGDPGNGYARTPAQAVTDLRLCLEIRLDKLRGEMADIREKLAIVSKAGAPMLPEMEAQ